MPPATQISSPSTVHAIINRAVGASGSERHCGAGWGLRGASFSASPDDVTCSSPTPVDPPIAYTVFPTPATANPCRALPKSGNPFHDLVARSSATTLLRTSPCDMPPTTTSRPSVIATPKSLRRPGTSGRLVHVSAARSYASTAARAVGPLVPPTGETRLPSDAAPHL